MAKHRKLYILQRDHSVRKSKKDIKTLLSTGVIDDQTEWVLIPIPDTSSTYIAVNGSAILMNTFNYGVIRYRMVLKALRMGMRSYGLEESIYHQYYTVEYPFDTVEELYYGIFNLLYFHYVKNLIGTSDSTDNQWLIEVPDVIIKMIVTNDSWYLVRNTQGVTGFVGHGSDPIPLTDEEVARMGIEKVYIDLDVEVGDTVRVISGPFESFMGEVLEINKEKQVLTVKVSMFGRDTPVELEFSQVDKL